MKRSLTALAALLCLGTSYADTVSVADQQITITGFSHGYTTVDTSLTGWVPLGGLTGARVIDGISTPFLTYCTEITQGFHFNTPYAYAPVANGEAHGFTLQQADLLGRLYTVAGTGVDSLDKSAAFQLAVWEIVHETTDEGASLSTGSFQVEAIATAQPLALASEWLSWASNPEIASEYRASRLYSPSAQDFVTFTPLQTFTATGVNDVPEPTSAALAVLALAGLGLGRKQRQTAKR